MERAGRGQKEAAVIFPAKVMVALERGWRGDIRKMFRRRNGVME